MAAICAAAVFAPAPGSLGEQVGHTALAQLVTAAPAAAGTYDVTACDAAPGAANNSWEGYGDGGMAATQTCPSRGDDYAGLVARSGVHNSLTACFTCHSRWTFGAPAGTHVASAYLAYTGFTRDSTYMVGAYANGSAIQECGVGSANDSNSNYCGFTAPGDGWRTYGPGTTSLRLQADCRSGMNGCSFAQNPYAPPSWRAGIHMTGAIVRIADESLPALAETGGALTASGWHRGSQSVTYNASDNVGIRATRFFVDDALRSDSTRSCDYTRAVPCQNVSGGSYTIDTTALSDGQHTYRVDAVDTAGNLKSIRRTIDVDNTAPSQVARPTIAGGDGWRSTNSFDIDFAIPAGQVSPIVRAHYDLCTTEATPMCTTGSQAEANITKLTGVVVPRAGDYSLRLHLEDAAGNRNTSSASLPAQARYDNAAPGQAEPVRTNGWLNAAEAAAFKQVVGMQFGALVPVSGVRGYSMTINGSDPDQTLEVEGDTYLISALPEGINMIKARALSGAGVASTEVGSTTVRVDRSAPSAAVSGQPTDTSGDTVTLRIKGTDQAELSGMEGVAAPQPIEEGAYVGYRLDGGPLQKARGEQATVAVAERGVHRLTYYAVDRAGNAGDERSTSFRIGAEAPLTGTTPGTGAGTTPVGTAPGGTGGGADGSNGSNGSSGPDGRDGGSGTTPAAPGSSRTDARVVAGFVTKQRTCRTVGSRRRCRAGRERIAKSLTLPFGKRGVVRGELTAGGQGLGQAPVTVLARLASAGQAWKPVGRVITDARGRFAYAVPAGASRTLRFAAAGAQHELKVAVAASSTIRANKRSLRVGQTLTLSGAVRTAGARIPRGGKVVDLQAFDLGKWRTFATPRSNAGGAWRYRYRFVRSRGTVTYPFRVVVRREAAFPFATGTSRSVKVRVRGL